MWRFSRVRAGSHWLNKSLPLLTNICQALATCQGSTYTSWTLYVLIHQIPLRTRWDGYFLPFDRWRSRSTERLGNFSEVHTGGRWQSWNLSPGVLALHQLCNRSCAGSWDCSQGTSSLTVRDRWVFNNSGTGHAGIRAPTERDKKDEWFNLWRRSCLRGQEGWVSSSRASGQSVGGKGFLGGGTSWAKAGEVWECCRKLGNSQKSGLTVRGSIHWVSDQGKEKKGENQVWTQVSDKEMETPSREGQGAMEERQAKAGPLGIAGAAASKKHCGGEPGSPGVGASAKSADGAAWAGWGPRDPLERWILWSEGRDCRCDSFMCFSKGLGSHSTLDPDPEQDLN